MCLLKNYVITIRAEGESIKKSRIISFILYILIKLYTIHIQLCHKCYAFKVLFEGIAGRTPAQATPVRDKRQNILINKKRITEEFLGYKTCQAKAYALIK